MRGVYRIFVEGVADKRFIEQLVRFQWGVSPGNDRIIVTDGYTNLTAQGRDLVYVNLMKRTVDDGGVNLVIFDADDDCGKRRHEILEWKQRQGVDFELFLLPDDTGSGALEDLLERIINPDNREVMDCWESYENAIKEIRLPWKHGARLTTPAKKTKIYAYLEVLLGASKSEKRKIKEKERNYLDGNHWDLNAEAISGLADFLRKNLS